MTEYQAGPGGWLRVVEGPGVSIFVRMLPADDGRLVPHEVYVNSSEPLTDDVLRKLHEYEAAANSPTVRRDLESKMDIPAHFTFNRDRPDNLTLQLDTHWIEAKLGRRRPSAKLKVPEGGRYPDEFYSRVAELYSNLTAFSRSPAADIAEANGVPASTAHRWIKEARRRGFLAPGRRGRAG